jgi:integrase
MAERITDKLVKELVPPSTGNRIVYDERIAGFGVRITARGARAFVLNYRNVEGRERRYTIGAYPAWSVEAARRRAGEIKRQIARGDDPLAEKTASRRAPTVADLAERYTADHLPRKRPSSQVDDKAMIAKIIKPKIGNRKVAAVDHADIDRLHRELTNGNGPYRANRALALLSKMFSLSINWGWRSDNPARGVQRNPEHKRKRYLSPAEIQRLTVALADHPNQSSANAIRLLLLTGARRGEVLSATWDQFDTEAGTWTKPAANTKTDEEHRVPLSAAALQLLTKMHGVSDGPHLFPGKPGQPQADLKKFWASVCKTAGITGCRVHDLRHTYASILASAGLSLPVIGALLGHTQPATTARYSHLYDDPLRKAANTVGAIVTGQKSAEVVPLKGERG